MKEFSVSIGGPAIFIVCVTIGFVALVALIIFGPTQCV